VCLVAAAVFATRLSALREEARQLIVAQGLAGDGNTSADWTVVDAHHVQLRAERSGGGDGRVYSITITATDSAGSSSATTVMVTVPRDQ